MHVPRGAPEPHDANADTETDEANERLQQETGEPPGRDCAALRVLQLLPDSSEFAHHARHGSGNHHSDMVNQRDRFGKRLTAGCFYELMKGKRFSFPRSAQANDALLESIELVGKIHLFRS